MQATRRNTDQGVTQEMLVALLGNTFTRWFSDSSETDFLLHLEWTCGCRARRAGLMRWLWEYRACGEHGRTEQ
jgi:hypothetical protein